MSPLRKLLDMSRRSCIVYAMVLIASMFAVSGCASRSNSTLVPVSDKLTQMVAPFTWSTKASMPTARSFLAAGVINNNILLAVGGAQGGRDLNTLESYNLTTDTWTTENSMPTAREGLAVGVINRMLYAVGGSANGLGALSTVEAYDRSTNTWTTKAAMPTARGGLAVGVVNGILYAVGGDDANGHFLNAVEAYNPSTNIWTEKASMPTARSDLAVGIVNGILYAVGGHDGSGALNTNEAYNPATNTWIAEPSMLTPSSGLAAVDFYNDANHNSELWAFGGDDARGHFLSTVEDYDPGFITWRKRVSVPTPRTGLAVALFVRKGRPIFCAIGGYNGVDLNTVEADSIP